MLDEDDIGAGGVLDSFGEFVAFAFRIMFVGESSVTDSLYVDIVRLEVGRTKRAV